MSGAEYGVTGEGVLVEARRLIDAEKLIEPGRGVVVAVSGGADSVALLSVLHTLAAEEGRGYRLTVAHLDHALRPDSDDDVRLVAGLADDFGLAHRVERIDVAIEAARRGVGIEEAARDARYDFLSRMASRTGATRVAVGHHADDQIETLIHRIARGTHVRGLCGMRPARPLGSEGCLLIRPMLTTRREQLREYCCASGLTWREDPTNRHTSFDRNLIRHEVLPLLRKISPAVDAGLLRLAESAARIDAHLTAEAEALLDRADRPGEGVYSLDAGELLAAPELIHAAAMRIALERIGAPLKEVNAARLAELRQVTLEGGAVCLPGRWRVHRKRQRVVFDRLADAPPSEPLNK